MKKLFLFTFCLFQLTINAQEICDCPSQSKTGKGSLYIAWGYNKDWHSKSDIHFKNTTGEYNPVTGNYDYYDFTIYDAKAHDRPHFKELFKVALSIPQYGYRLGYYFNNKKDLGIEISFDHTKYIMDRYQLAHVKGNVMGKEIDTDTIIDPNTFLHFEHSDGANFLMLNFMKRQALLKSKNKKHWLSAIVKAGGGVVIPRTYVLMFGQELNTDFHLAGWIAGAEVGFRYDAFKYLFIEYTAKGTYADFRDVLLIGSGRANHHFWTLQNILVLGLQFPL